jgi:hypothetical protein
MTMPTRPQIIAIQKARRQLQLNEAQYRTLLWNTAGVESSKDLDNAGVEDVMAVLEDLGFDSHPGGKTYWRDKVARRGSRANERVVHKINELAAQSRYDLAALCERFSQGRSCPSAGLDAGRGVEADGDAQVCQRARRRAAFVEGQGGPTCRAAPLQLTTPPPARVRTRCSRRAVAEGRHAPTQTVCDGCREWCDGIYYITFGKQRLCATCADTLAGAGPEAVRKQREGASYVPPRPPQQHTRPAPQGAREPAGTDAPHGRGAARDGGSFSRVPQVSCQEAEW